MNPAPKRRCAIKVLLLLASCLSISSCVYFNTFYNAKKYFRQAEEERREYEESYAYWAFEEVEAPQRRDRSTGADELYDKAARKASKVLEKYKESDLVDDAMFLMGRSFYWRGEYLRAIESFRDLEINFPASEFFDRARYWRAQCLEAQRIYNQALQLYRSLFSEANEKIAVQAGLRLGEMAYEREDYVAAIQEFRATLEAYPKNELSAQLWLRLGDAQMALEDEALLGDAQEAFRQALSADPNKDQEYRAWLNSGLVLYAMGEEEEALQTYERLLQEGQFRMFEGRTRLLIGQYYHNRHLLAEALSQYEQVRDDFPQSASSAMALYRTGLLHLQEYGDTELANEYLEEANREKPGSQGALLSQEMLGHLARLSRFQQQVHHADSLFADSLGSIQGPLVWKDGWETPADTLAGNEVVVARNLEVLDHLFSACEIYRDEIGQADSAVAYYQEVIRRFPESDQLPRAVYSIAWITREMVGAEEEAMPYLLRLIEEFPSSTQANEARYLLGQEAKATADELAAREFERIESLRLEAPEDVDAYVPLLDSLIQHFPDSQAAGQAAFLVATTYENVVGDTVETERRYRILAEEFAETKFGKVAQERQEARAEGLIAKLERSLKAVGGQLKPGEEIELLALEPDTLDTVSLARKYLGFALRAQRRNDIKLARDFYERSIEEQFNNPRALYLLGNITWEDGYFDDAIELYRHSLAFDKKGNLNLYYRLWKTFTAQAEEDSANFYLREIVRRDRNNPQIRFLQEEFPDFYSAEDQEDLDLDQLEELDLSIPEDKITWEEKDFSLSEWPLVRKVVVPVYPTSARDSVEVLLDVLIDREGRPEQVEVFRGEDPFASSALTAAYEYGFYPAVRSNGVEIKAWVELSIPFVAPDNEGEDTPRIGIAAEEFSAKSIIDSASIGSGVVPTGRARIDPAASDSKSRIQVEAVSDADNEGI